MKLDIACHLNAVLPSLDDSRWGATLAGLAELGYTRVVLPFLGGVESAAERVAECHEHGLRPIAMCRQAPERDVSSVDADVASAGEDWLREQISVVADLGIDHITGLGYGLFGAASAPVDEERFRQTAERVGRAADFAHERGVMLSCEVLNRYETAFMNTAEQGVCFVEASDSGNLKLHLDTFHMAIEEKNALAAVTLALPHLGYLELGQSARGQLSEGIVPIEAFVRDVLDAGYEGRWGVEAFSAEVLNEGTASALSIWRAPYSDGLALAADAMRVVTRGASKSAPGRRHARLARAAR